jgi:type 1 fimbriae regulatory protein FimB
MQALSKTELLAVLAAARAASERDFLMILVAYCHGLRASEVIAITRHDIQDGCLDVKRLKKSMRTNQPLLEHADPLLNERQALLNYIENLYRNQKLFPVCRRTFYRIVNTHAATAGLPKHKRHPHMLKHTIGTEIYQKSKDLGLLQTHLGHKKPSSSLMYSDRANAAAAAVEVQALVAR